MGGEARPAEQRNRTQALSPHRRASTSPALLATREHLFVFALIFTCLFLTHAPLLRLPYFWDEAGYFIPAARDLLLSGSLVPHSTLSNAHPPLVMAWLAFWWKFSGFTPAVTRISMLLLAAFGLLGVWRLARDVANDTIAFATVLCTGLYPVFFAQSSLAQLDIAACALTMWGLAMYLERRPWASIVFFSLAALAKETAIVTPVALLACEVLCYALTQQGVLDDGLSFHRGRPHYTLLLCCLPLAGWFLYLHHQTGHFFGNQEFLRYNLQATITPLRIALATLIRLWHLLGYLNLFVLTFAAAWAMRRPPLRELDGSLRSRISLDVQLVFAAVMAANVVALSALGGAVLARYMLPVLPLVILLSVSTLWRRIRRWAWWIAFTCATFVLALMVPPPYRIAPEDSLLYRDYVLLHKAAADNLSLRHGDMRVLTAWPASDELTRPFLGYVKQPMQVVRIENFSAGEIARAAQATHQFDYALLFSTKWEPPNPLWSSLPFGKTLHERFFDYHEDMNPQAAAAMLGGRVLQYWNRNNEWVAIVAIERVQNASLTAR